jgi:hypothetical protein
MKCQKSTKAKVLIWNESYKKHSWFWNFHYSYVASKPLTYKTLNDQDEIMVLYMHFLAIIVGWPFSNKG